MAVTKEYNIRRHCETKHYEKYKDLDVKQKLQKMQEMKRSLVFHQTMFMKAKSKSEAAVKASLIVAAEITKSAQPFNEGKFVKKCMVKVCDIVCLDKKQDFLNVNLSRNTVAERMCEPSTNTPKQLIKKGKILLHNPLLWMRAATRVILPSCQSSFVE